MGRIAKGLGWIAFAVLATLGIFLAEAHWEIRRIAPLLADRGALDAKLDAPGGPIRLHVINTATQPGGDGGPSIGHPSFRIEWPDGRVFLIDVGMDPAGAEEFGRTLELLIDAEPIQPHGSLAEQLGADAQNVAGVAFTHLHIDHTQGFAELCRSVGRGIDVFETTWQARRGNYTTASGREAVDASGCARKRELADGPVYTVPGFPGLVAVAAGGHTPGSTVYFVRVGDTTWALAGDISNFHDALIENRPKPKLYSLLVTPEATTRLEALRRWLAAIHALPGYEVVVSHDVDAIAASGPPAWSGRD